MLMSSGPFTMYQKKRQRKSGGSKNIFFIYINMGIEYNSIELREINDILDNFDTAPTGVSLRERTFYKRAEAEKAWIYLTLRYS